MNHIIYEMDGDGEYSLRGGTCKILTVLCCSRYWMLQTCDRFLENVLTFSKPQFKFPKAETSPRLLLTSVDLVLIPAHIRIYIYICDMRCGCLKIQEYNKNDNFLPFSKNMLIKPWFGEFPVGHRIDMLTAKYMVWTKLKTRGIAIFGNSKSLW